MTLEAHYLPDGNPVSLSEMRLARLEKRIATLELALHGLQERYYEDLRWERAKRNLDQSYYAPDDLDDTPR
jgi:uncharacterized protein YigA (DUF484 family)